MKKLVVDPLSLSFTTREDGVSQATIYEEGDFVLSLIEIPKNTLLRKHWHPENEYIYVLNGTVYDDGVPNAKGTFFVNPKGSCHQTSTKEDGCRLLVLWCGSIDYEGYE